MHLWHFRFWWKGSSSLMQGLLWVILTCVNRTILQQGMPQLAGWIFPSVSGRSPSVAAKSVRSLSECLAFTPNPSYLPKLTGSWKYAGLLHDYSWGVCIAFKLNHLSSEGKTSVGLPSNIYICIFPLPSAVSRKRYTLLEHSKLMLRTVTAHRWAQKPPSCP